MTEELVFVGDVHGNLKAVQGLWNALFQLDAPHVVFLGDYLNKGPRSADVMEDFLSHASAGRATLLAGNHELALLDALGHQDLLVSGFLKMGGAMTIRSYVRGPVGADVLSDFLTSFPPQHLDALRRMPLTFETEHVLAQHAPFTSRTTKFHISAHVPVGSLPSIRPSSAQLDTGCGSESGRLTALRWPSLKYLQVDSHGNLLI